MRRFPSFPKILFFFKAIFIVLFLFLNQIQAQNDVCYTLIQGGNPPNTENNNYGNGLIKNENDETVYAFDFSPFNGFDGAELCLAPGCYSVEGGDGQGNGWGGVTFSMSLEEDTVVGPFTLEIAQFNFANKIIGYFTVGNVQCDIVDCMDPLATNFNPFANIDACNCIDPPMNDLPENALEIQCGEEVWGNTINATRLGIPEENCFSYDNPLGRGVWYKINGTGDTFTANTCGSNYDASVIVYNSDFTCADQIMGSCQGNGVQNTSTFNTDEGSEYFLFMTGPGGEILYGDYLLRIFCEEEYQDAQNITCEDAIQLTCGETQFVQPVSTPFNGPQGCSNAENGVWYSVDGTSEVLNVDIAPEDPVKISLFSGTCNNENIILCEVNSFNFLERRSITFETNIGESYFLHISGLDIGTNSNDFPLLNITLTCGLNFPSNDTPCEAIEIYSGDNVYSETFLATEDSEFVPEECTVNFFDPIGIWYKYHANESGHLRLNSFFGGERRTPYFPILYSFSGQCDELTCANPVTGLFSTSFDETIEVNAGVDYFFMTTTRGGNYNVGYFEFEVTFTPEVDCSERGLNIGDPCDNCSSDDVPKFVQEDCSCAPMDVEPGDCNNPYYYLTSTTPEGADIFKVELDEVSATAELTYLKSIPYEVHIAFNQDEELMYLVRSEGGSFRTLDVSVFDGDLGEEIHLESDQEFSHVTIADFTASGALLIGDMDNQQIVEVNINTGEITPFAQGNVSGGDISFGIDGLPYLASRIFSGSLYRINIETGVNEPIGDLPNLVTGMTTMPSGNFLISYKNSFDLVVKNADGSDNLTAYSMFLEGNSFMSSDGDLTKACSLSTSDEAPGIFNFQADLTEATYSENGGYLYIYPNPAKDFLKIIFNPSQNGYAEIQLVDSRGVSVAQLFRSEVSKGLTYNVEFNARELPDGLYLCRVISQFDVITSKVIISK